MDGLVAKPVIGRAFARPGDCCSCAFYFAREAAGASCAPGIPCALYWGDRLHNSGVLRREIADVWTRGRRLSDFTLIKWLPGRNDCCQAATPSEHLTLIPAHSCLCRFLATPLDEIICS
jgi:hypothetical protein